MSKIYEVRSLSKGDNTVQYHGARNTREEAEEVLKKYTIGENKDWGDEYYKNWTIEEIDTTGLFQIPSLPKPRDRYKTKVSEIETSGPWRIEILDETESVIASYVRNDEVGYYSFEPFRQGSRMFALIAPDYTATSVMDLETGEIIASETPSENGFCPVGFYVPDWWDINDGRVHPRSEGWGKDYEEPKGNFGLIWGCVWGDDYAWNVQYLDLSKVQEGKILREERFGYVKLAYHAESDPRKFIDFEMCDGKWEVSFPVLSNFDLDSGKRI